MREKLPQELDQAHGPKCRFSGRPLLHTFVNLGMSPLANSYVSLDRLRAPETFYPLHVWVSEGTFLVQAQEFATPANMFSDYAYFSSVSETWLAHASAYADDMVDRFGLGEGHQVVEIASNDGYLLQYFKKKGIPVIGVEPAANVARVAEQERGIRSIVKFFGTTTAKELRAEGIRADLLIGNNVLAHVPDLNDFVQGMKIALKPDGIFTMEFPHLLRLISEVQFDTIYHEHYSYFSFLTAEMVFRQHGLTLFDVDELPTHGGSLRIYGRHAESTRPPVSERVAALKTREIDAGLTDMRTYVGFADRVKRVKRDLLQFLITAKSQGKSIVGYGAAAKGNTLLNYCGIRSDFLDYVVDLSPHKQGLFLPGTHLPIRSPSAIYETKPDYVLILPWNLKDEIRGQMGGIREWGGRFVVPIPSVEVLAP